MKYEVKIRFQGHVSYVEADASNASQAKALVEAQYGEKVTIISCSVKNWGYYGCLMTHALCKRCKRNADN